MARSLTLTQRMFNGITNNAKQVGIISERVLNMAAASYVINGTTVTGTLITYAVGDNSLPTDIFVTQSAADIQTSINTANTSNNIDSILITKKNTDGTTQALYLPPSRIYAFYAHPDTSFDTLLMYEDEVNSQVIAIKADQTIGGIVASLNS